MFLLDGNNFTICYTLVVRFLNNYTFCPVIEKQSDEAIP